MNIRRTPKRIRILLICLFTGLAIFALSLVLSQMNVFAPKASDTTPQRIVIANATENTATVIWATPGEATLTTITWGDSATSLTHTVNDIRDAAATTTRYAHEAQLTGLQPGTTYYYRITVGQKTYPVANQDPSTVTTLPATYSTPGKTVRVSGTVSNGTPDTLVLAYVNTATGYDKAMPLATATASDGTWSFDLSQARMKESGLYIPVQSYTPVFVVAEGGNRGMATITSGEESPTTLSLNTNFTSDSIAEVLYPTVTTTPTPTSTSRQDVPIGTIGAPTDTPTPTATPTPSVQPNTNAALTADQLFSLFATPTVSNISDTTLSIMWISTTLQAKTISYGTSASQTNDVQQDDRDPGIVTPRKLHHITLTGLTPQTRYFFRRTGVTETNAFTMPASITAPTSQKILSGTITNAAGECLIRTQVKRGDLLSSVMTTLPDVNAHWSVNIAPVRTTALDTYFTPGPGDTILTNAFCITPQNEVWYQALVTPYETAVNQPLSLTLIKLQ